MKTSNILILSIGSGILATGLYLGSSEPISDETAWSTDNQPTGSIVVPANKKNMWEILDDATKHADKVLQNIPSERDQLIAFINNNPTLRYRIQNTTWYQEFLSGKCSIEDTKKHIRDATLIEEAIKSDPNILMQMQNSGSWRNYLSGTIPPHNIIYGEIPAMLSVNEFSKQNPEVFAQIQRNPMFQGTTIGWEATFSEQKSIIEWMLVQEKIIKNNPTLRAKFEQYGYTQSTIYASDWREGRQSWFFAINDAIYSLENPKDFDPIIWKQFQESDIWAQYRSGTIDPREAYKYINTLILQNTQNE